LSRYRGEVRPFKVGPDFIDPIFHKRVSGNWSVNLDTFIMSEEQVRWLYSKYGDKRVSIIEGVMGFYDGEDRGCSTYSVTKALDIPTLLVIDASGSYITISALLKGILEYKRDNTVRGVILNRVSSEMHYRLIKRQIESDHSSIEVLGWIKRELPSLKSTHLGLDLEDLSSIDYISKEVLESVDIERLESIFRRDFKPKKYSGYPFPEIEKIDGKISVVFDRNFSFLYYDNLQFLKESFREVEIIDSTRDDRVSEDSDIVYIAGGYIETDIAYSRVESSDRFRESLIKHSKSKAIYGECAGLLYLSKRVDDKIMSGILDIEFTLNSRFTRLGYYYSERGIRGHAFHYTKPTDETLKRGICRLKKRIDSDGEFGSWGRDMVYGTYLHTMFRATGLKSNGWILNFSAST